MAEAGVSSEPFGTTADGTAVTAFTLTGAAGMVVRVSDYGGRVLSLVVPDREGSPGNVVLGFDRLAAYLEDTAYVGALVGRYANRIAHGRFSLDGRTWRLTTNDGPHHLHGGDPGFHRVVWSARPATEEGAPSLVLRRTSPAGEAGYPGTLTVRIAYTVTPRNELVIDYQATTDEPTAVNLTHHSYFNLAGAEAPHVLGHLLEIEAEGFLPIDGARVPTGEIRDLAGTPFDFREPVPIGSRIDRDDEQLRRGAGYDHTFVLRSREGRGPVFAGRLTDPSSGRVMEVHTTEPGMQVYTGNYLQEAGFQHRAAVALETQHFPDSPNRPNFPSAILRPGEEHRSRTVYRFTTDHG